MGPYKVELSSAAVDGKSIRLTVAEAATVAKKTPKALRMDIARNRIPYHRWGKNIVILEHELLEFMSALPGVSVAEARRNAADNYE